MASQPPPPQSIYSESDLDSSFSSDEEVADVVMAREDYDDEDYGSTCSLPDANESLYSGGRGGGGDSLYSSASDATTSIASEVTNYKFEFGRRYHSYSSPLYPVPNDRQQTSSLDILHHILHTLFGTLHLAPLPPAPSSPQPRPPRVLDLGTGTGLWALELADLYPHLSILGNDLSPIQPPWIPSNLSFEVDDFTKPWLHPPNSFQLIRMRGLAGCSDDWTAVLGEALNALKEEEGEGGPGWVEWVEVGWVVHSDGGEVPAGVRVLAERVQEASGMMGRKLDLVEEGWMKEKMEEAGLEDVVDRVWKLRIGGWANEVGNGDVVGKQEEERARLCGRWAKVMALEALEGECVARLVRGLGLEGEEARDMVQAAREGLERGEEWRGWVEVRGVIGRKNGRGE